MQLDQEDDFFLDGQFIHGAALPGLVLAAGAGPDVTVYVGNSDRTALAVFGSYHTVDFIFREKALKALKNGRAARLREEACFYSRHRGCPSEALPLFANRRVPIFDCAGCKLRACPKKNSGLLGVRRQN